MQLKVGAVQDGFIDGIGISLNIYFQGCKQRCEGCHNPSLQDFEVGYWIDTDDILKHLEDFSDFYASICYMGGEPLEQLDPLFEIATKVAIKQILSTG